MANAFSQQGSRRQTAEEPSRSRRATWLALPLGAAIVALSIAPTPARAQSEVEDLEESDKLPAVQNRKFRAEHEFNLGVGVLPVDPLVKGMLLIGGYAWHLTDLWAADFRFSFLRNFKTSLREKLEENFTTPTTVFDEFKWYGQAGVLFKPLYGKLALFNKTLVYGELYLSLHGMVARLEGGEPTDEETQGKGPRLGFGGAPGFGLRGYLNEYFSVRFDFRSIFLYSAGELHTPISLSLTLAVTTRSDL